eukprot:15454907-Alexandrium_andersonii.AAC.1
MRGACPQGSGAAEPAMVPTLPEVARAPGPPFESCGRGTLISRTGAGETGWAPGGGAATVVRRSAPTPREPEGSSTLAG